MIRMSVLAVLLLPCMVQAQFPGLEQLYIDQSRRTLQRAYDRGDRDPGLLAVLGLESPVDVRAHERYVAASIVAKVTRDRLMGCVGAAHPGYGFERHMGYSVPEHFAALNRLGPCVHHRRRFAPVAALLGLPEASAEVDEAAQLSL